MEFKSHEDYMTIVMHRMAANPRGNFIVIVDDRQGGMEFMPNTPDTVWIFGALQMAMQMAVANHQQNAMSRQNEAQERAKKIEADLKNAVDSTKGGSN